MNDSPNSAPVGVFLPPLTSKTEKGITLAEWLVADMTAKWNAKVLAHWGPKFVTGTGGGSKV